MNLRGRPGVSIHPIHSLPEGRQPIRCGRHGSTAEGPHLESRTPVAAPVFQPHPPGMPHTECVPHDDTLIASANRLHQGHRTHQIDRKSKPATAAPSRGRSLPAPLPPPPRRFTYPYIACGTAGRRRVSHDVPDPLLHAPGAPP